MNPREKAIIIYSEFLFQGNDFSIINPYAKEDALEAINILINDYGELNKYFNKYWNQVKKELIKL